MRSLRPLTIEERCGLEADLKRTNDLGEWRRLFVILRYVEGQSIEELAKSTRLSPWTIQEYLKEYSSKKKTKNDPRGGRSSKLTESETAQLKEHLSSNRYLKVKNIIAYVSTTFGKQYSRSGMTDWLINNGFIFKRPEKVPGKLDSIKQEQFIEGYQKLKGILGPSDELYFLDTVYAEYQSQAVCGWIMKSEC